MSQKVVFITGSANGVGLHLTDRFCTAGYRVIATDINFEALKALATERQWSKDSVLVRKLDITDIKQWQTLWKEVIGLWERVDVMCNIAGYLKPGMVHQTELSEIDQHIDINVKGLILGSKTAAEQMIRQGKGHIINIASLAGIAPIPGITLYSASKFAVRGFTLALAQELKPLNIDVTVICPDAIETPMLTSQENCEEAAITFSGSKTLVVEDIGRAIFERVLINKPMEITLPLHRGLLAKLGGAVPGISLAMGNHFRKLGRAEQERRRLKNQG